MLFVAVMAGLWTTHLKAQERLTITLESGPASFVAVSPDSKILASGNVLDTTIRLWNAKTGKELLKPKGHVVGSLIMGTCSVTFSPDGKTFAVARGKLSSSSEKGEGSITFWDTKTWKETRTLRGHDDIVRPIAFSPDGKTLTSGSEDKTIVTTQ
jgi:WD40 repeat protein